MTIDYAKVLAVGMNTDERFANDALAAPIPDLCPDCHGSGSVYYKPKAAGGQIITFVPCEHSNAPTIGDRLTRLDELDAIAAAHGTTLDRMVRIAAAVLGAESRDEFVWFPDGDAVCMAPTMLDALRAVQ